MSLFEELKYARRHVGGAAFAARKPRRRHRLHCTVFRVGIADAVAGLPVMRFEAGKP